jgi:hypothetical protein
MSLKYLGRISRDVRKDVEKVVSDTARWRLSKSYVGVNKKRVFPPAFELEAQLPRVRNTRSSRPAQKKRVTPKTQSAGINASAVLGGSSRPVGIRGINVEAAIRQEPGLFSNDPAERALALRNVRERVQRQASRGESGGGGGVAGFVGRTLVNLGRQSYDAAVGLPGAVAQAAGLVGDAAIVAAPARIPAPVRERSGERITDFVGQTAAYYPRFFRDFAKDPIGTVENRPLEVVSFVPAAWNVFGRSAAGVTRATGATGRLGADIRNAPSVRVGVARTRARVAAARAEARRAALTPDQIAAYNRASMMANPYGAPGRREFKFDSRQQRVARERAAAEVTGNRVGGRVFDITQRIGDWGSDSFMPGSRRFRGPEKIAPPSEIAASESLAPVNVSRRPRSSNPISREIQVFSDRVIRPRVMRGVVDPVRSAVGMRSRYEVAVDRATRNRAYEARETTDRDVLAEAAPFARLVRQLRGSGRMGSLPQSEVAQGSAAAALRLMGLNDPGFGSRTAGRDILLRRMRERVNELDRNRPGRSQVKDRRDWNRERRGLEQNIETLESIPDEWLDPETAPKVINDLVAEEQRLSRVASREKVAMGLISPSAAVWSDIRAQAQLLGAEPASSLRARTSTYLRDLTESRAIREEIRRRGEPSARRVPGNEPLERYSGYTTEALRVMERARARRGATLRSRVTPFIRDAEEDALRPYENYQAAQRLVAERRARLNALRSRRDGSAFDEPIARAVADLERGVQEAIFERDRAAQRLRMAQQGARAARAAQVGRQRRQRAAAVRDQRRERESARFELERARQRLQMARQGRIALSRAEVARLQRTVAAAQARDTRRRQDARSSSTPTVAVELNAVFRAGQRSGRAESRASLGSRPGELPTASQSRAFGTMARSDGMLFVARNRQTGAETTRREVAAGREKVAGARGRRRVRSAAEERALREAAQARARLAAARARSLPAAPKPDRRRTPAEERALREAAQARGNLRGVPRQAAQAERRRQRLIGRQSQDRLRPVGTQQQIAAAQRALIDAQRGARNQRARALRTAYVGYDRPEQAGMTPGLYYPVRRNQVDRPAVRVAETGGRDVASGASYAPPQNQFNRGVNMERGDIDFSPQQIINMIREAFGARERTAAASDVITRFAMRDNDGRLITGDAARKLAADNEGFVETITMRQLARISSLSANRPAGQRLIRDLEEAIFDNADSVVAIPTAVRRGWSTALGKSNILVRSIEYINSLWKGGVLALNPRWYMQNFFGMWGQFALGAGADLQAISMARSAKYIETIPGRIAANGLAADLGEYARRMQGRGGNPVQQLIRAGFNLNSILEGAPRRAMFWSAAKRNLQRNQFMERGVMNEAYLARAWADVVDGVKRGDLGAEAILDETILVTERFMGNYARYNRFEKNFMRLVFPFYGWMRSIHRLGFALPFKHPKRAALLIMASQMAYEESELNRNRLTAPRSGIFIGNRMIGTSSWNPAMSLSDTFRLESEAGGAIEGMSLRRPASLIDAPYQIGVDALRSGFQQAGPIVGIPFRAITGETPAGIPDRFSPGYDGRWAQPTGGYTSVERATGSESNDPPRKGLLPTIEQAFPIVNNLRRAFAGGTPVADATLASLAAWAMGGRPEKDAPYMVVNDPRTPAVVQTDGLSALLNILTGTPFDRVDWNAAEAREDQALTRLLNSLEATEARKQEGIAQQVAKRRKARRP